MQDVISLRDGRSGGSLPMRVRVVIAVAGLLASMGADHLVGWAWAPGGNRKPAPGTQKEAGALVEAWVRTGAVCPK
jgi:hypothetical protein